MTTEDSIKDNIMSINELSIEPTEDSNDSAKEEEEDANTDASTSDSTPNFGVKHPLQNSWTLWYDNPQGKTNQNSWADQLKKVVTFDTVEDFWRIFNNIRPASKLATGANYHLFKEGIEPKWEDTENRQGGKWIVTCKSTSKDTLDKWWMWTVLGCIGENFDDDNEVLGCVVSIRKGQDRLALWTKTWNREEVQRRIGTLLKRTLEIPEQAIIGYSVHADSLKRNSSFNNRARYEL